MKNVCNYVLDNRKTYGFVGGRSVLPETAVMEIELVQSIWRKQRVRRMRHYILSFSDGECITYEEALSIAYEVAGYRAEV